MDKNKQKTKHTKNKHTHTHNTNDWAELGLAGLRRFGLGVLYNVWELCIMCGSFGPELALYVGALYNVWEYWTGVRILCESFV